MNLISPEEWDTFLSHYPNAHLLQTTAWGQFKEAFGWQVQRILTRSPEPSGAQVLFRRLPMGIFTIAYIPKGPVGSPDAVFWKDVDELCRQHRAIFLKVEPDSWDCSQSPPAGFRESNHSIQPQRTLVVDLTAEEDHILGRMKQKTRYNIRLALRKGIVVRTSSDINAFYRLLEVTGGRDEFGVHSPAYYRRAYEHFHPQGECELFLAEFQGEPLAGLMAFAHGQRAWYFYGASSNKHRERMPTYLLQWEAMRWARAQGCKEYDMWGVPDADEETLEANFTQRSDGLWGVYRFKRGFGGELRRSPGPWDRVYRSWLYQLYNWWVSRAVPGSEAGDRAD
jgi:peptidoglycan pentaglycine glycine transferase (the first glycine)